MNDFDFDAMYADYINTYNRLAKGRYMDDMYSRDAFEDVIVMAQFNPKYFSQSAVTRRLVEAQAGPTQRQVESLLYNLDRVKYKGFEDLLVQKDRKLGLPEGTTTYLTVEDLSINPDINSLIRRFINIYSKKSIIFASIGDYEGIEGSEE